MACRSGVSLFSAFTDEDFDRIMAVNVTAVFAGSQAALPYHLPAGAALSLKAPIFVE